MTSSIDRTTQIVRLAAIPGPDVAPTDFSVETTQAPRQPLPSGSVLVELAYVGLNAGLRSRLGTGAATSLGPAIGIGDTPRSDAIGVVLESASDDFAEGDRVRGLLPWQSPCVVDAGELEHTDSALSPLELLTVAGHVGATAYAALVHAAALQPGETVWISAAAGGVGTCAVQFAKALGARVIASAGGEQRVAFLTDQLGADVAIDRSGDLAAGLHAAAPDGIDAYIDLVGGDHLRVALDVLRARGRAIAVGRAGPKEHPPVLESSGPLISRRLQLIGMSVTDFPDIYDELTAFVSTHGPFTPYAEVSDGFESIPAAFATLFAGSGIGRGIVQCATA